ncbi:HAMP domain-containing histidine kinase [Massilia sp. RP-1-19]|uniref:histidine kinase n=1 Tax=Massilia polaris TaxID=2728846 RepID=A0A848HTA5_9BURK|nr:HAMP domain-containing sensor histidine kinase [Massilia polaris]NML63279.1 HAMP domain-containing histidine kinase [Massilia polaris]
MRPSDSLRRRIVVAFLAFGVVCTLFFTAIAAVGVEGIEVHLVDNRLTDVAAWAAPRHTAGMPVDMPAGLSFHRADAIPQSLRDIPPGVHEIEVDGIGLHVLAGQDSAGRYVVVDHESDYEKVELIIYSAFAITFFGFLLFAALLGGFVARRVVNPMTTLADAVASRTTTLPLLDRRDELGTLARAFDGHTGELRGFLDRERFFTGDVSHELRSPLTVIMGAAEILMTQAKDESVRVPAERIYRAANEAAECITVLLLLARAPELAELPPVQVSDIAITEAERYRPMVSGKPVELICDAADDFSIRAPRELCAAAIGNLIRNACQYTEEGLVKIRLEGHIVIVEDTGPGLPAAVRATLEQPAGRVPSTGSAGTGLGLALARRICEYLGATLAHADRVGGGSVFTMTFPPVSRQPNGAMTRS